MRLRPAGFFVVRTPLLPFSELAALSTPASTPSDEAQRLTRERLRAIVSRAEVREALFVASPSLSERIPVWQEAPDSEGGQKVERALMRYVQRMAARPTPFGLFAGCSLGQLDLVTRLHLAPVDRYRRHTRLDGDYLTALTEAMLSDNDLRHRVRFFPNSSLHWAAGRLHYAEWRLDGVTRSYHLVAVEPSEELKATIAYARQGATLPTLADTLACDEISFEEALQFVEELADRQVLVSEFVPSVTGSEPIHDLIEQLKGNDAGQTLAKVRDEMSQLDASPLGVQPTRYREIAGVLGGLPVEPKLGRLFQVDLFKPAIATLGPEPIAELVSVMEQLWRLRRPSGPTSLARFRRAFVDRYQDREVPLAEVLDDEVGIGFERSPLPEAHASPLLQDIPFPSPPVDEGTTFHAVHAMLLRKLQDSAQSGADEIVLDPSELETLRLPLADCASLPGSLAVMATLYAQSAEAVAAGHFVIRLHGAHGPSGANLLGRFCHGDPELTTRVLAHLRDEEAQRPDAVFAEVVHLPEGRTGNLLLRPRLRSHEIVFLGRSGAPPEQQLTLGDLLVTVRGDRVVLRSEHLGREVIPRLTSAHSFSGPRNLATYRFLCALQHQGTATLGLNWGPLEAASFLPRLRLGKVVLQPRRWRIDAPRLEHLLKEDRRERVGEIARWREELTLPRWISFSDTDHTLPVDLDNRLSVATFAELVKRRRVLTITEFATEGLCVSGPEGAFIHELVIPFVAEHTPTVAASREAHQSVARHRPPGSEWLYAKLYCGASTADRLLRDTIAPLLADMRASAAIDTWFFIRYGDPDWHLRVRFRGNPILLHNDLLPLLEQRAGHALERGQVWRLQFDTYDREIERYGGDHGMALAEKLFCADSDACLKILQSLMGDDGADARWRLALRGMDQLLDDLGFSLHEKLAIAVRACSAYGAEYRVDQVFRGQVASRFRKERSMLEELLDRDRNDAWGAAKVLAERTERVRPLAAAMRAAPLSVPFDELAVTFLHMHANRMLRSAQRAQEVILHDFLARLYRVRIARCRG